MKKIFTLISGLLLLSALPVKAEAIKVNVKDEDNYKLAQAFETELTKDSDGNYVIADFFGSGSPVKFTFNKVVNDWGSMTITSKTLEDEGYLYLLDDAGQYLVCQAYDFDGIKDWTQINYPCLYMDYTEVYTYDLTDSANAGKKEFFAEFYLYGSATSADFEDWIRLTFSFDEPTDSNVESIEDVENAPIEFFSISGQKVETPSNGIFIRKQGNKVAKIAIH
ncbi:MAG: hypothetical protein K2K32_04150 [Muribaculaceae bacterium]|nr:hypothetical protein [Muribaculaceae bacterium]